MKCLKYFLILLFIPFIVLAEECDISKITITSIEQKGIEGNAKELDDPKANDREIKLNLKMYEVGDSISYDMTINNASEEDYMIDEDTFKTDSEYIEYTLKTNDNSNVVKAQSTKDVTLTVTYKKEIEDDLLNNNKFDASNSLKLSLNTNEKEKELDIITTDNIKESLNPQEVKNPVTSVTSVMLISIILLTTIIIAYVLIKRKNRYTKYLLLVLSMLLIPTVYAICKVEVEVKSTIEIEKTPYLYKTIVGLVDKENACVTKYDGDVTDEVGKTVTASNVYFDKCVDQRNVIFGGFCWQVIRTTETKGTKVIYNGEPVDGKCESTRGDHKGLVGGGGTSTYLNESYLYGSSFTYDTSTNEFTLIDTNLASLNYTTYENLISKYTCKNTTGTCTTLYNVNGYDSGSIGYISYYTIGDTNYAQIGTDAFNANDRSPSNVGYMFDKVYKHLQNTPWNTSLMGNDVTYSNGTYTLLPADGENTLSTTLDDNHHYTCNNTTGTCNKVRYYYLDNKYIELDGEANIEEAVNNMLYSDNVNRYNSSAKGIIDTWYRENLFNKTNLIEDTVYCNARNTESLGAWVPNGGNLTTSYSINFKNYIQTTDLSCQNITDQFAVRNNKAKLIYPVALLQNEEILNLDSSSLITTGAPWWSFSPSSFNFYYPAIINIYAAGNRASNSVGSNYGLRPVISLSSKATISGGTGSESDPWIIE